MLCLAWLSTGTGLAQVGRPPGNWKFDTIQLKSGRTFQGLVGEETAGTVLFKRVLRDPGERTKVYETSFPRSEIRRIDKLTGKDRDILVARVKALDRSTEKQRLESLDLKVVPWEADPRGGLLYRSEYFVLRSNAREAMVRPLVLRLEQLYAAYLGYLPPRHPAGQPTTIVLIKSLAEYQELLRKRGLHFQNPAFYDVAANQIVCGSDLERLSEELAVNRKKYLQLRKQLEETKEKLRREYKDRIPADRLQELAAAQDQIKQTDAKHAERFEKAARRLYQTLYHEAFHAYLTNFVYPATEAEVPRWLNEGLAQIFETAEIDVDELLIGRPDPGRLQAVKAALRNRALISLEDLLQADPQRFLVAHDGDRQTSNEYYLASWALTYYLTFERKKLGTPEMDEYVHALKGGVAPLDAFAQFVGQPLLAFEDAFHLYFHHLRGNGRTTKLDPGH
jgi:hypothetical protein